MITFKAIIIPNNRRKDGTFPVKIRVTFKGVSRRIPTTLVCQGHDVTRTNRIKNADILMQADELIKMMRNAIKDVSPFDLDNWNVDDVIRHIRDYYQKDTFKLDFFEWGERCLQNKSASTRRGYDSALNALERFIGKRELDINDITRTMLMDLMDFIDHEPKMRKDPRTGRYSACQTKKVDNSSTLIIMKLQHLFNLAKDRYNDGDEDRIVIPRSPFDKIKKVFPANEGQKNLGQQLMQRIINAQTDDLLVRHSLDAFIVSFGLMGANMADLYHAIPFEEDTWIYHRQKTRTRRTDKAEMRVDIPDEIRPYIARLQEHRGEWWLPTLHIIASSKDSCTARVNAGLKRWCVQNNIPVFTFYAARHTWASIARRAGVEKATIDECLAHKGDFLMADIYAEKDWSLVQRANRKVIDEFEWKRRG